MVRLERTRTQAMLAMPCAVLALLTAAAPVRKPFVIGATGAGADSDVFPTVLRKMFKLPMKTVAGDASAAEVVVAIKRAEVDGRCGWSWSSLISSNRDMFESKELDVVLQVAAQKLGPGLPCRRETAGSRSAAGQRRRSAGADQGNLRNAAGAGEARDRIHEELAEPGTRLGGDQLRTTSTEHLA
jgi:hypothetical protein